MDQNSNINSKPAQAAQPVIPPASSKPVPKKFIKIGAIALAAILLIVLGIIFIPKLFKGGDAKLAGKLFSEDILIAVEKDNKYGYIDLNGKMVIQPQFESASNFSDDHAIVEIEEDGSTKKAIIDRKGNIVYKSESRESISYDTENEIWSIGDQIFDKNLKKILPEGQEIYYEDNGYYLVVDSNNKYEGENTIYNKQGKAVYSYKTTSNYWDITDYTDDLEQAYAVLGLGDNKYIIINPDSGKVIAEDLNYSSVWADDYTDICLYDGDDCNKYLLIWNDKVVKEYDYEIDIIFYGGDKNGYYKISDDSYGSEKHETEYFDLKTGQFSKEAPKGNNNSEELDEWEIATGYRIFSCNTGYGLMIDKSETIPCEYSHIRTPNELTYEYLKSKGKNYVIATKSDKSYILQANNGKVVTEFNSGYLSFETLSSFVAAEEEDDKYHVYNLTTGKDAVIEGRRITYYPMYIKIENSEGKTDYYNKNLKLIYTEDK